MTIEAKLRIVAVVLVCCAIASAVQAIFLPLAMAKVVDYLPTPAISIPIAFGALSSTALIVWSFFYLPEPLRFIATGRFAILSVGILSASGQALVGYSSVTASVAFTESGFDATAQALPGGGTAEFDFWPATITLLVIVTLAAFLTWLYFVVASDQRDSGHYFQD